MRVCLDICWARIVCYYYNLPQRDSEGVLSRLCQLQQRIVRGGKNIRKQVQACKYLSFLVGLAKGGLLVHVQALESCARNAQMTHIHGKWLGTDVQCNVWVQM